jgi:hypothetical protein
LLFFIWCLIDFVFFFYFIINFFEGLNLLIFIFLNLLICTYLYYLLLVKFFTFLIFISFFLILLFFIIIILSFFDKNLQSYLNVHLLLISQIYFYNITSHSIKFKIISVTINLWKCFHFLFRIYFEFEY